MALPHDYSPSSSGRSGFRMIDTTPVYSPTLEAYVLDTRVPDGAFRTYAVMQILWRYGEVCDVPLKRLAELSDCKERTVISRVQDLLKAGWITEERSSARPDVPRAKAYRPTQPGNDADGRAAHSGNVQKIAVCPTPKLQEIARRSAEFCSSELQNSAVSLNRKTGPEEELRPETAASQPAPEDEPIVKFSPPTTAPQTSPVPTTKPLLPVPKPKPEDAPTNARLSRVADLILAAKIPVIPDWPRDGAALKRCPASPEEIAACYVAIARGEYGDPHMHKRLSIRYVVSEAINGWLVRDQAPVVGRGPAVATRGGSRVRKDGSRIYTSEAGSALPADMQARLDANTRY